MFTFTMIYMNVIQNAVFFEIVNFCTAILSNISSYNIFQ